MLTTSKPPHSHSPQPQILTIDDDDIILPPLPKDPSAPGSSSSASAAAFIDLSDEPSDCVISYVDSKLQENEATIRCPVPNCPGLLEREYCRSLLPSAVFERWGKAMCDAVILGSEKFYCPYQDCSALMISDGDEVVRESQCPHCARMLCGQCRVAWHVGMNCEQFQRLSADERGSEDVMLRNLAQSQSWRRCPNCKFYVEKSFGCSYMKCRCGFAFCYNCGVQALTHTGTCRSCRR